MMIMKRPKTYKIKDLNELAKNPNKPFNLAKNRIWSNFKTPTNENVPFHRKTFFRELLWECGEFDAFCDTLEEFTFYVSDWTNNRLHYWQRMYDILCAEYEPLWNYNRFDDDYTNTDRNTDRTTDRNTDDNSDNKNSVAGYDSGNLVENYENIGKLTEELKEQLNEKLLQDWTRNNHSYGNIGVMSSQDLVKQELEICTYSMYNIIINDFKEKFCILVY